MRSASFEVRPAKGHWLEGQRRIYGTVCRGHHRELHRAGNEVMWWQDRRVAPLEIAKGLWEQTRPKSVHQPNTLRATPEIRPERE